ncbi:MAG: CDF family Co(II)/Ni(II) efflux transporter DmeF [Pseudomonadota bacterium]
MHSEHLAHWAHDHTFNQDKRRPGESRTLWVIAITAVMMVVEVVAGLHFGSMALLADGLHMASHTVALGITAFAYAYARRHASDRRFSFGTGKVNALGGFTGAVLLAVFAVYMAFESVTRLFNPVEIAFNQAIAVAVLGLIVNGASVFILDVHDHGHDHGHGRHHHHGHRHDHAHSHTHDHSHHQGDHNLRSAYLHVMADALTSLLAIVALLLAKYVGWVWMDPIMGIAGAVLVARWSCGLLATTASVLLDRQASDDVLDTVRKAIEGDGDSRVTDLHVWSIGPGIYAAQVAVVAHDLASVADYKARVPEGAGVVHLSVETHKCEFREPN